MEILCSLQPEPRSEQIQKSVTPTLVKHVFNVQVVNLQANMMVGTFFGLVRVDVKYEIASLESVSVCRHNLELRLTLK